MVCCVAATVDLRIHANQARVVNVGKRRPSVDAAAVVSDDNHDVLFGLPEERLDEFLALANTFFRSTDPAARAQNIGEIYAVLDQLFREKERNPGNDIATQIVMARDENGAQHPWEDILNANIRGSTSR